MDNDSPQNSVLASDFADHGYPMDIITAIVSCVYDRSTLWPLCLTNHFVGREARRLLYQSLGLDLGWRPHSRFKRLLACLAANRNLPPLVQRLTVIKLTRAPHHTEETLYQLTEVEKDHVKNIALLEQLLSIVLGKVLPQMANLEELTYRGSLVDDPGPSLLAPGGITPFQLRLLRWGNKWDGPFIDFLKTQKELRVLSLSRCPSHTMVNHRIPEEVCTRLTAISGDQRVVEAILPFAPRVKHVVMRIGSPKEVGGIFGPVVDMTAEGHLARAMPQLTSLAFLNTGWKDCTHFSTFGALALSGLRVLTLNDVKGVDEEHSVSLHLFRSSFLTKFYQQKGRHSDYFPPSKSRAPHPSSQSLSGYLDRTPHGELAHEAVQIA